MTQQLLETRAKKREKLLLAVFLLVPLISSVISTIHLVDFVGLGNLVGMSIALAFTFELGSLVSFVTISGDVLRRIKKQWIFFVFILLFSLQAIGNVYSSFEFMINQLIVDPKWLDAFQEMTLNTMDLTTTKLVLSCLIGLPIPMISLILLKSAIDYFYNDPNNKVPEEDKPKPKEDKPEDKSKSKTKRKPRSRRKPKLKNKSKPKKKPVVVDESSVAQPGDVVITPPKTAKGPQETMVKKEVVKPDESSSKTEINKSDEVDISFIGKRPSTKKKASVKFPFKINDDKLRDKNTEETGY